MCDASVRYRVEACPSGEGVCCVASADLEAGDLILSEEAVVVAPAANNACVDCARLISATTRRLCAGGCGQPVCPDCAASSHRHSPAECAVLRNMSDSAEITEAERQTLFNMVMPVRLILLEAEARENVLKLEGHVTRRMKQPSDSSFMRMSYLLRTFCPVPASVAMQALGVELTNAFDVGVAGVAARAVFPRVSRVNHSCLPNVAHTNVAVTKVVDNGKNARVVFLMELSAQRAIRTGQQLTIRYNSVYEDYVSRQRAFSKDWFFTCSCLRCRDRTELGTHMSAVRCLACRDSNLSKEEIQRTFVIPTPTAHSVDASRVSCGVCNGTVGMEYVKAMERKATAVMTGTDADFAKVVQLLADCKRELHPSHYLTLALKRAIVLIPQTCMTCDDQTRADLLELQEHCARDILEFLEAVDPGRSKEKTTVMQCLVNAVISRTKLLSDQGLLDAASLRLNLGRVRDLTEAVGRRRATDDRPRDARTTSREIV